MSTPTPEQQLEHVNTVGMPAAVIQDHVFDCHEEMTDLRRDLQAALAALAVKDDGLKLALAELEYTWMRLGNRDAQFDKTHATIESALALNPAAKAE